MVNNKMLAAGGTPAACSAGNPHPASLMCAPIMPSVILHLHHHQMSVVTMPGHPSAPVHTTTSYCLPWSLEDNHDLLVPTTSSLPQLSVRSPFASLHNNRRHQHEAGHSYCATCSSCVPSSSSSSSSSLTSSVFSGSCTSYSAGSSYYSPSSSVSPSIASSTTALELGASGLALLASCETSNQVVALDEADEKTKEDMNEKNDTNNTGSSSKCLAEKSATLCVAAPSSCSYVACAPVLSVLPPPLPPPPPAYLPCVSPPPVCLLPSSSLLSALPSQAITPSLAHGLSLRDFYASLGVYYNLVPWNQSYGMERVWMSEFRRIFSHFYNELWSIQPVENKPSGVRLNMFVDAAKVRFSCEKCGHSWTSMKGRIVFWYGLLSPNFNVGIVAIKLFGQRCERCEVDGFQQPMWYPEEVTKVLINLFNRVGQIFYGFEKTRFERQRRIGKPRTPHNQYLCQACSEGICLNRKSPSTNACPGKIVPRKSNEATQETRKEEEKEIDSAVLMLEDIQLEDKKIKHLNSEEEKEFEEGCSEDSGL